MEQINKCKRCGYSWKQRGILRPVKCPRCSSPYWNVLKKEQTVNELTRILFR